MMLDGGRARSVMYIASGVVKIVATTREGDEVTLAVRRQGDLVGDHSVLAGSARSAGVIVLEPGEALIVPADQYLQLLQEHPDLAMAQVRRLLRMLQEADDRVVEIATTGVAERVLSRLRALASEATRNEIKLSQNDLAALCIASRGAVAGVLARLRDLGVITTARRSIEIIDPQLLASLDLTSLEPDD